MDFYLSNISQVPKEDVPIKGTKGVKIQWLITKNEGAITQ